MNKGPCFAGVEMHIDLHALQENYRKLATISRPAECGAAVKANAYGLGMKQCATALWEAGCRTFFVALTDEACQLRAVLPDASIYVLNGLAPGAANTLADGNLRPVLASREQVDEWVGYCREQGAKLSAALHIESGINRLGLTAAEVAALAETPDIFDGFELSLVISHLASADEPDNPINPAQIDEFNRLRAMLPAAPASLANSSGTMCGKDYHFDLTRPGIALFGSHLHPSALTDPMKTVVRLYGTVMQSRHIAKGETVGYSTTWKAERPSRIAVIAAGYADGYQRALSFDPAEPPARVWIDGHYAPVVGRVSMDMITVDVTDIPDKIAQRGDRAELLGDHISVDELAHRAGTISYEIFTGLGLRAKRVYSPD
ncbi:MAG: alanine racemase [Hyphomicrobiales bacterium]